MSSKYQEALDELCSRCYVDSDKCTCHPRYEGGKCGSNCEYRQLIQELVDKEKTKKPIIDSGVTYCPRCHWVVELTFVHNNNNNRGLVLRPDKYCHNCGQRLREK